MSVQKYTLFATAILLCACASTPDPAEVCTAQWIQPRTEKAVSAIAKDTKSVMKNLRKVAESHAKGNTPGFFQMWGLQRSFKNLEREFENGRGVKDLRTLARTCDDPKLVSDALTNFMRGQGLPENIVNFVTRMEKFIEVTDPNYDATPLGDQT